MWPKAPFVHCFETALQCLDQLGTLHNYFKYGQNCFAIIAIQFSVFQADCAICAVALVINFDAMINWFLSYSFNMSAITK